MSVVKCKNCGADIVMPRILKRKEVVQLVGISAPQLYRNVKAGLFPPPYELGEKAIGWKMSDIIMWMENLKPVKWNESTNEVKL